VSNPISLTLLTKPGCHLCEEAKKAIEIVMFEFSKENSDVVQIELTELNILEDEALKNQYSEEIPVLQINGATHAYWKIDSERLLAALNELV
jgi:glutaredoxin